MKTKIAEIIFEAEKTTSVWDRGHQFRVAQDFNHICFVSKHNPLTRKTCFIIAKCLFFTKHAFIMFRQCLYASSERNNLPHPPFRHAFQ